MASMTRTQIYLTVEQRRRLRAWSKAEKKTASALVRTAIEEQYVQRPTPADFQLAMEQAFGAWEKRKEPSLAIVRDLRRGKRLDHLAG
jgi:predicted DNA-binding protein